MRVLVVTVVHNPEDARIRHRQIPALLDAGFEVTYVAPSGDLTDAPPGLRRIEVPRAAGRRRLGALLAARRVIRAESPAHDLTIIHDPELTLLHRAITGPRIWDVHEDLPAQIADKSWIPAPLRTVTRRATEALYRRGGNRFECIIAERGYAETFNDATVVRNAVAVPDSVPNSEAGRAVYLGRVSKGRGADLLAEIADRLLDAISIEVLGPVDADATSLHDSAATLHGFVPNDDALRRITGASVGLSLLDDLPNYRHSMPTKVLEYLAHGIPVITTPLPEAVAIVESHDCGVVVPFGDADAVTQAIIALNDDDTERARLAENGRQAIREHFNWADDADLLIDTCRRVVDDHLHSS